jgi:pimeloyl-ACP methyl ester carboxylesterase
VIWLWVGLTLVFTIALLAGLFLLLLYIYLVVRYLDYLVRIFQERPFFIVPRGQPIEGAEGVRFPSTDGLMLHGCYLRTTAPQRQGVLLFGTEFGSNCWSCLPYCEHLLANGFDVFSFEPRNQGDSDREPGYEPLQWITNYEVLDCQAALAYLKQRPDSDPAGVGFFGISMGGGAGLLAASRDRYVRCFVTDGIFATYTTMVPYMRKWIKIYSDRYWLQVLLPTWFYGIVGRAGLRRIGRERGCRFPHLERAITRLAPRPLLMIHGGADTYIKPEMAQVLYDRAGPPKEFWLVDGAKHNQALQVAGDEYRQRVLDFFQMHLGRLPSAGPQRSGTRDFSLTRD